MKKIALFLIGLLFASIPSFADTRASILLLHNGQGKSFDATQLQAAVHEAVTGDAIYLSEGSYDMSDTLIIDKNVSIIGTGQTTKLRGNINISIGSPEQTDNYILNGMRITGDVIVRKELNGLKIKKTWIGGYFYATDSLKNSVFNNCYIKGFVPRKEIRSAICTNCIICYIGPYNSKQDVDSRGNDLAFINCGIANVSSNSYQYLNDMSFINSIIAVYNPGVSSISGNSRGENTFINCLFKKIPTTTYGDITEHCYADSNLSVSTESNNDMFPTFKINNVAITVEALSEKEYLGNDGTVVGADGGTTPYTLQADGVRIKESVLKVDPVTRQLNVTLKVE